MSNLCSVTAAAALAACKIGSPMDCQCCKLPAAAQSFMCLRAANISSWRLRLCIQRVVFGCHVTLHALAAQKPSYLADYTLSQMGYTLMPNPRPIAWIFIYEMNIFTSTIRLFLKNKSIWVQQKRLHRRYSQITYMFSIAITISIFLIVLF